MRAVLRLHGHLRPKARQLLCSRAQTQTRGHTGMVCVPIRHVEGLASDPKQAMS